jgi:hypothetical protein
MLNLRGVGNVNRIMLLALILWVAIADARSMVGMVLQ